MAGLEPARACYGPTDFKSVASTISPHRRDVKDCKLVARDAKINYARLQRRLYQTPGETPPQSDPQFQNQIRSRQGTLARIFSISDVVKARIVCVRMFRSRSAASNTLAAVSSSG